MGESKAKEGHSIKISSWAKFLSSSSVPPNRNDRVSLRFALHHAGDDIRAADPVGVLEVGGRRPRGVVGMGVIEAHNLQSALPRLALRSH